MFLSRRRPSGVAGLHVRQLDIHAIGCLKDALRSPVSRLRLEGLKMSTATVLNIIEGAFKYRNSRVRPRFRCSEVPPSTSTVLIVT